MGNLELMQDEKGILISALKDFSRLQKQDLDRANKEPEWAKRWEWVLHKTKRDFEMAQAIIARLEKLKN